MLYINGTLAPKAIADSIGIASERSDTIYSYCFYAKGYPGEILRFNKVTGPYGDYYWSNILRRRNFTEVFESNNPSGISMSPQPSYNGFLDIKFNKSALLPYRIDIYDAMGNTVISSAINSGIGEVNHRIDLSNQPTGSYFIKITSETGEVMFTDKALIIK